jgi:hypothetical protein
MSRRDDNGGPRGNAGRVFVTLEAKARFVAELLASKHLSSTAKALGTALVLVFHNSRSQQCNPSIDALSAAIGKGRRTTSAALTELTAGAKWVSQKRTRGTSHYTPNFARVLGWKMATECRDLDVQDAAPLTQDDVRDPAHLHVRDPASLDVRDSAHRTHEREHLVRVRAREKRPPSSPRSKAQAASRKTAFVAKSDPRYETLAERFK